MMQQTNIDEESGNFTYQALSYRELEKYMQ